MLAKADVLLGGVEAGMESMRRPLVALLLSPDEAMWEAALSGAKRISIREGFRDYQIGDTLMLCCHIRNSAFMAKITEVRRGPLSNVSEYEYLDDGFESREALLAGLQAFYPNMTMDSPVTVIRWGQMQGTEVQRSTLSNAIRAAAAEER